MTTEEQKQEQLKTLACKVSPKLHAEFKAMCCLKQKATSDVLTELVILAVAQAKDRERQLIVEETLKAAGK